MRSFFLFLLCTTGVISALGQTSRVSGTVLDKITKEGLLQATVVFQQEGESPIGVLTDFDGAYATELPYGTYTVKVNYVGYEPFSKTVTVDRPSMEINAVLSTVMLKEATVTADIAIERETPVAFSNVKPKQIQEELGSQPLPMILNTTPGVYATQEGSDDTGPSITIRGFKQRNVSVMIDGIPVNDMQDGRVFWGNWFGLDMVTQTMQVQRGLGASKLALPAIGGTVNILTQGINNKPQTMAKIEGGTTQMARVTLSHTTGRLKNGWGLTVSGSYQKDEGWVEELSSESWFYYAKLQKEMGDHIVSISALGAPSRSNRRSYQQRIGTYDKSFARDIFKGDEDQYQNMQSYSTQYWTIANDDLLGNQYNIPEQQAALDSLNAAFGFSSRADFEELMSEYDYIDTTGIIEKGPRYNQHWGYLNGERQIERSNVYHKPLFSLRHSWRVNDKFFLVNTAYASFGRGGGTSLRTGNSSLGDGDFDELGQVDFQRFYNAHTTDGPLGPPSPNAGWYLRRAMNNHYWYGLLSTFNYEVDERWNLSGGIDLRDYQGETYGEMDDLLGAEYFIDNNGNQNTLPEKRYVGDRMSYYSDSFVRWAGVFGLLEFKNPLWTAFLNVSGVYQGYNRKDYYARQDVVVDDIVYYQQLSVNDVWVQDNNGDHMVYEEDDVVQLGQEDGQELWQVQGDTLANPTVVFHNDPENTRTSTSDWKWIPGYTVKAGGNYNINEWHSAFVNVGLLNRTPVLRNVIGFDNQFVENTQNEIINSIEFGYGYSRFPFSANINAYYTDWNNRPLGSLLNIVLEDENGIERFLSANIPSMSAVHMGFEVDAAYQINDMFTIEGFVSVGDWKWDSSEDALELIDQETLRPYIDPNTGEAVVIEYDAKGVAVGDAPQTQIGGSLKIQHKGFYLKPRFTYFARHYADFDPFSLNGDNARRQSWQIPAYGVLDAHAGYTFKVKESQVDIRVSGFNILNTVYIINAQNNDVFPFYLYRGDDGNYNDRLRYYFNENNFDAASASVYMGYGARGNVSVRVRF